MRPERERGSAVVEFALVLPLLLVVALALVQVGVLVRDRLLVEADEGAIRVAALAASADLDPSLATVQVVRAGAQGAPVTVTVGYEEVVRIPLVGWLFGSGIHVQSEATDRQEFG